MLDFDCTSKFSNGKNAATKAQIQNFAENQHFWQLLSRNVETAFMAQHSRKDCGHLRVFLLKHLFCHVFPISQWWVGGPANIILRTPLSELVCISQEKECRNYFRRGQKVMKKNQRIIQVCNASHFKKLWFCPFTRIWHHFRTSLRMCPTSSFCAVSFKCLCSSSFQWQILA